MSADDALSDSLRSVLDRYCGSRSIATDPDGMWMTVRATEPPPKQGWKVHVSSTIPAATTVLERTLPALIAEGAAFKVASEEMLQTLNLGKAGISQIGKFITIYPMDDEQAIRLAVALDEETRGLPGPAIPSDRPLHPGSLVHYRYGAFHLIPMRTLEYGVQGAIWEPNGTMVPDLRASYFRTPDWATDPFMGAGVADGETPKALVAGKYLITATFSANARGSVHTAFNTRALTRHVLKRGARHGSVVPDAPEARERLRSEYEILLRLAPDDRFPSVHELVEQDGDLYLVMEDVGGQTMEAYVDDLRRRGTLPAAAHVVAWGLDLAAAVQRIHREGYLLCDLKPSNVIVTPALSLRLLDLDGVAPIGRDTPGSLHSPGYTAPEVKPGHVLDEPVDVYSLGAVLYFLATGAQPSNAPDRFHLLGRPMAALNPGVPADLEAAVTLLLHPDPSRRPQSMDEVTHLLSGATLTTGRTTPPMLHRDADPLHTAQRLAGMLCREGRADAGGLCWPPLRGTESVFVPRTLYEGQAGIVLALATFVEELDRDEHRQALEEAARWLEGAPMLPGARAAGLYDGEAGEALALLRAAHVLRDERLLEAATARARSLAAIPHHGFDLLHGAAGRARFHLMQWSATGSGLDDAVAAGTAILGGAVERGEGLCWPDEGIDALAEADDRPADRSTPVWLGYGHGSAGIGDVLLDLWEVTGDDRFRWGAEGAARRLIELAEPVLRDGSGVAWHRTDGGRLADAFWCHGAAGIGRFLLHAARLNLLPETETVAHRAAITVQQTTLSAGPSLCHGLAGNMAFLLDMYRETGVSDYLEAARTHETLLQTWLAERNKGPIVAGNSATTSPYAASPFDPGYMLGVAGVALALLRAGVPGDIPDLARSWLTAPRRAVDPAGTAESA